MPKYPAHTVNGRGFHFKITDAVVAEPETGELVDQVGLGETHAQQHDPEVRKTRTGNGDACMKSNLQIFSVMKCPHRGYMDWKPPLVQLCMRVECMQNLFVFLVGVMLVKIEQVVEPEPMRAGNKAVHRYFLL